MKFRDLDIQDRQRKFLKNIKKHKDDSGLDICKKKYLSLSDTMIENAIGFIPIPLGVVMELTISGKKYDYIPLATEEPSVIAGLSKSIKTIKQVHAYTISDELLTFGSIYIENPKENYQTIINENENRIKQILDNKFISMKNRGGGYRYLKTKMLENNTLSLEIYFNTCDSMGANLINTAVEFLAPFIVSLIGGQTLMAIVSNDYSNKLVKATFSLPVSSLNTDVVTFNGNEIANRIVRAYKIAEIDPVRAVPHNKGILNGIEAFALATGQDTRAVCSSIMHYTGQKPLSKYEIVDDNLIGSIQIPSAFSLKNKVVSYYPPYRDNLAIMNIDDLKELSKIAATIGLLQNFTALRVLVESGINKGHIKLHNKKD